MLLLLLVCIGLNIKLSTPPGFLVRLTQGMDDQTKESVIKLANKIIRESVPISSDDNEINSYSQTDNELTKIIQDIIDQEGSMNIVYQKPGVERADLRHISPLLIEKRGQWIYVLAYCHDRKANRTFRLDRLKLV
jgi:predicted DNA-binding transcriptional regulator YafY